MSLTAAESLEITQLITRADNCATARDANGYVELFTEDGVMTGNKGSARGRVALRDAVTAVWAAEPPHTLHLTLNVTIDESGPDPSVRSVMLMVTRESPPRVLGSALVRQVVRRTSDGWRIASREIVAA
ncbi:MAG: nuclear transport factor 2 family protein [Solirubrobacteraceae bacterium]